MHGLAWLGLFSGAKKLVLGTVLILMDNFFHSKLVFLSLIYCFCEGDGRKKILGGGFKYFLFSSLPGGMIQFD